MRLFILDWNMWLPATFEDCHWGPGHTWTHPRGQVSRLDYIAIFPTDWPIGISNKFGHGRSLVYKLMDICITMLPACSFGVSLRAVRYCIVCSTPACNCSVPKKKPGKRNERSRL